MQNPNVVEHDDPDEIFTVRHIEKKQTNFIERYLSIRNIAENAIAELGEDPGLLMYYQNIINSTPANIDVIDGFLNQINNEDFTFNNIPYTRTNFLRLINNLINEYNMGLSRRFGLFNEAIRDLTNNNYAEHVEYEKNEEEYYNGGLISKTKRNPNRKPKRKTVSKRRKSKKQIHHHRTPKKTRAKR